MWNNLSDKKEEATPIIAKLKTAPIATSYGSQSPAEKPPPLKHIKASISIGSEAGRGALSLVSTRIKADYSHSGEKPGK